MKRSDKNILIVSYYYPPYLFGGALRMHYLRQYLEEEGYSVGVITAQPSNEKHTIVISDPVPSSSIKKKNPGLKKYNPMPDSMFIWSIRVSLFIRKYHKQYSRIIISIPPYSAGLFMTMLPRPIRAKIILDMRDTWSDGPFVEYANELYRRLDRSMESLTYSRIDSFTGVTEGIADDFSNKCRKKMHCIRNPIDKNECKQARQGNYIVYPGKIDNLRVNRPFLNIYESMRKRLPIKAAGAPSWLDKEYQCWEYAGSYTRKQMLDIISQSYAGLIMLDFNANITYMIPAKLLDYVLCKKPVLYVGPRTVASEFIEREGIGVAVTSPEKKDIIRGIERILEGEFIIRDELIEQLDYHSVFEKYLRLLDTASLNSGGP
ncbi:MAG: glycosyltransferase [bacterium]